MRTVLLAVVFAVLIVLNSPGGNATTTHHGIELTDGTMNAPLSCDNNSQYDAVIYYHHKIYKCPRWALTEVQ